MPFGAGAMCEKGPRERSWSVQASVSSVWIVWLTERRSSTCREEVRSGGIKLHVYGGCVRPVQGKRQRRSLENSSGW